MSDRAMKCSQCKFWIGASIGGVEAPPEYNASEGWCHRNAPSPRWGEDSDNVFWPVTFAADWCGEWASKP